MAVIGLRSDPFAREIRNIERMSRDAGVNIQRNMEGGGVVHGRAGALREVVVILREISRGNWSRVPSSLSILLGQTGLLGKIFKDNAAQANILAQALAQKSAKSTLAALAAKEVADASVKAGTSMARVSEETWLAIGADKQKAASALLEAGADRTKAVAAREAATAMKAEGLATRFSIGPLGWAALAVVALGTAMFFTVKHILKLQEETKKLADLMDTTTVKFSEQSKALKEAAEGAQAFSDWLETLADNEDTLASKTERGLKMLRERAKFERELAQENGASKKQLAEMEIAEAQKELELVTIAKLQARRQVEEDESAAREAESNVKSNTEANGARAALIAEKSATAGKIVDEIKAQMKAGITETVAGDPFGQLGGIPKTVTRAANGNDKFPVKGMPDMSLNEAMANFNKLTGEGDSLAATQKQLADVLNQKKKLTEKDNTELTRLTSQSNELSDELGIKKQFLPKIAEAEKGHFVHGTVNSNQQIGAFAASANYVTTTAHTHLAVAQKTLNHVQGIHSILGRIPPGGNSNRFSDTKF